jgi:hypothetical protein
MQQYYQHGHSLFVELSEFRVLKLYELAIAVGSNIIRLNPILKFVIYVCQGVNLAIVMLIADNFVEERLVSDFICQGHTLIVCWVFYKILLTKTLLLV